MPNISTVLAIFLMLIIGYIAKKTNILKEEDCLIINKLVLNLTLPAFIIVNVMGSTLNLNMFITPFISIVCSFILIVIAYYLCKLFKFSKSLTLGVVLTSTFANTGFLGYPIISSLFTDKKAMPAAVILDQFGMQFVLILTIPFIVAFIMKNKDDSKFNIKDLIKLFSSPIFPITILALIFHKLVLPEFIMKTCGYMASATVPLAMLSIGLNISTSESKKYVYPLIIVIILKLFLAPVLMYYGTHLLITDLVVANVVTMQFGLPSAVLTGIMTTQYKGDAAFASSAIFVTTLFSIVLIPLLAAILGVG